MTDDQSGAPAVLVSHGLVGTVRASWRLYRSNLARLLRASMMLTIPLSLALAGSGLLGASPGSSEVVVVALLLGFVVLFAVGGSFVYTNAAVVMVDDLTGRDTTSREAFSRLRRLRTALVIAALYAVIMEVLLFLAPPLALLGPAWVVLGPPVLAHVIAVEGSTSQEAMTRARFLWSGGLGRGLSYLLTISLGWRLLALIVAALVSLPVGLLGLEGNLSVVLVAIIQGVVDGLFLPFMAAAALMVYLDMRVRKDDLDLAMLAEERAAQP